MNPENGIQKALNDTNNSIYDDTVEPMELSPSA
jgi:hypothetical protein